MKTLHLMTQRDQPYGSQRKCCEYCGLMLVARPDSFWREHTWTDEPDHFKHWPAGSANVPDELLPCWPRREPPNRPIEARPSGYQFPGSGKMVPAAGPASWATLGRLPIVITEPQ